MSVRNRIDDLTNRRARIEQGGGQAAVDKIHADGKLTARERIDTLLDDRSFVEVGAFVKQRATDFNLGEKEAPADGVITGYGTINGRLVYVYSQDATVFGGALGEMHSRKIVDLYDKGLKMGAPIIALIDSAGLRLQEATDALAGFASIFMKQSLASGVIPQITAILGNCGGGSSIVPSLSDFTFMTSKNAKLFVNSPNALDDKNASFENYASADFHGKESGIVDCICESDEACLQSIRELVELLPANNLEESLVMDTNDDLNRVSEDLNDLSNDGIDAKFVITSIADNGIVFAIKEDYGPEILTAFIRLNGGTVGVVANNTGENEALLSIKGCKKAASFIRKCDAFSIPVVTLTDVEGFRATVEEEKGGISKAVAKMTYEYASATVAKVNIIMNRAYGSAYLASNSKHLGADLVYAWPNAKISVMEASSAVKIMYAEEINTSSVADEVIAEKTKEYNEMQASPYTAASRGYIDDIIEPAKTRQSLIAALEMLYSKRDFVPEKKHGTV